LLVDGVDEGVDEVGSVDEVVWGAVSLFNIVEGAI